MSRLSQAVKGLRALLRRSTVERELDEELQSALDEAMAEGRRVGLSPETARLRAQVRLGNLDAAKTAVRQAGWEFWVDAVRRDVFSAAKSLRRTPGFTAIALLTLSFGIGANASLFSLINGILLRSSPLPSLERLVALSKSRTEQGLNTFFFSAEERRVVVASESVFDAVMVSDPLIGALSAGGQVSMASGELVSGNYFDVLGVPPLAGRLLQPSDELAGTSIVLSERFWRRVTAADPGIVGAAVTLAGQTLTVVGIAPMSFNGTWLPSMKPADFFVPVTAADRLRTVQGTVANPSDSRRTFARMRAGVALVQADAAVRLIGQQRGDEWAAVPAERAMLFEEFARPGRYISIAVLALSAAVFLIACANLMNLFLARTASRRSEIGIRLTAGASPRDVKRLVLAEVAVLTLTSAVLAFAVAWLFAACLARLPMPELEGQRVYFDATPDLRAFGLAFVFAFLAARAIGLLPAQQAVRTNPVEVLTRAGTGQITASAKDRRTHTRLVALQVGLSVVLVLLAALTVRNARSLLPNREAGRVDAAVARVNLARHKIEEPEGRRIYERLLMAARAAPGVSAAALSSITPDGRAQLSRFAAPADIDLASLPECSPAHREGCALRNANVVTVATVSPGFIAASGLRLSQGRDFGAIDAMGAPFTALVTEEVAARFWPGGQAVGQRLLVGPFADPSSGSTHEVVGVVDSGTDTPLPNQPSVYLPMDQQYAPAMTVIARGPSDAGALVEPLRRALRNAEPTLLFSEVGTIAQSTGFASRILNTAGTTVGILGALGFAIALIGVYGVVAYTVSQRRRELAIRKALGATTLQVYGLVLGSGVRMLLFGAVPGVFVALGVAMWLRRTIYRLLPFDPVTFVVVPVALVSAGAVATWLGARREVNIDPNVALKNL